MLDFATGPQRREDEGFAAPKSARIADIEVLRAIAVMMVMVEHISGNLVFWPCRFCDAALKPFGWWTGVDVFLVISGFVIARSFLPGIEAEEGRAAFFEKTMRFWVRRAWRLLPSAWLWLAVPLVVCVAYNRSGAFMPLQANWEQFVAGILDIANFRIGEVFGVHPSGTAFVQWSLSLEEQFYLALPVVVFLCRGRRLALAMLAVAVAQIFIPFSTMATMFRFGPIALGVLLALWSRGPTWRACEPKALAAHRGLRLLALWLPIACLVSLGTYEFAIVNQRLGPIEIVAAVLVWVASYNGDYLWRPGRARRAMEWIAARSYSLYLVHVPVYYFLHETWFRLMGHAIPSRPVAIGYVILGWALAMAVADANHRLLERPLRAHGRAAAKRFRVAGA